MARPDFTPIEQYYVHAVLKQQGDSQKLIAELGYLIPSGAIICLGVYSDEPVAFLVAFTVILIFRLWDVSQHVKAFPVCKSIFQKYESALAELSDGDLLKKDA